MLDLMFALILYMMGKSLDKTKVRNPTVRPPIVEPMIIGEPSRSRTYLKEGESWEDLV